MPRGKIRIRRTPVVGIKRSAKSWKIKRVVRVIKTFGKPSRRGRNTSSFQRNQRGFL